MIARKDKKFQDVRFMAKRDGRDNCLCDACHGTGCVTKIIYPEAKYYDGRHLTAKLRHIWLCDECLGKLLTAIREARRPPVDLEMLEESGFEI